MTPKQYPTINIAKVHPHFQRKLYRRNILGHIYSCGLVVTCWERAGLLAHLCVMFPCVIVTFPYGVLGQVWYLIVSIPDICLLSYFNSNFLSSEIETRKTVIVTTLFPCRSYEHWCSIIVDQTMFQPCMSAVAYSGSLF